MEDKHTNEEIVQQVKYEQFMLESNRIEGENRLNPGDIEAVEYILSFGHRKKIELKYILKLHAILGNHLGKYWVGQLRDKSVMVGGRICPYPSKVPSLMYKFLEELPILDSWSAHNKFELIHPFRDLNGRVGRLIWLAKAVKEGYNFEIPFLQMYYYQTLRKESEDTI